MFVYACFPSSLSFYGLYKNKGSRRNLVLTVVRQTSSCHRQSQGYIKMCWHILGEMPVKGKKGDYMLWCCQERPESTGDTPIQEALFKLVQLSDECNLLQKFYSQMGRGRVVVAKVAYGRLGKPLQDVLKVWVNQKDNSLGTGELWKIKTFLFIPWEAFCICVQLRVLNILHSSQTHNNLPLYSSEDLHKANSDFGLIWLLTTSSGCDSLDQLSKIFFVIRGGRWTLSFRKIVVMSVMTCQKKKILKVVAWMRLIFIH